MSKNKEKKTTEGKVIYYVDATNVCYWRDTENPSIHVLLKLLITLKRDKGLDFYCIFDANTRHKLAPLEKEIYDYLLTNLHFHQVTGGKRADDYILSLADAYDGCVISNDNYSDNKYSKYKWKAREARPTRLFMGEVIETPHGEHLMLFDLDINETLVASTEDLFKELELILNPPREQYEGNIKFFSARKGWGRITYPQENTIYFNKAAVDGNGVKDGLKVKFNIGENEKGTYADNVQVIPEKEEGVIVQYDNQKNSGFIQSYVSGKRYFFYQNYVSQDNTVATKKGQRVEFVASTNSKGDCGREVKVLGADVDTLMKENAKTFEAEKKQMKEQIKQLENLAKEANKKIAYYQQEVKTTKQYYKTEMDKLKKKFANDLRAYAEAFTSQRKRVAANTSNGNEAANAEAASQESSSSKTNKPTIKSSVAKKTTTSKRKAPIGKQIREKLEGVAVDTDAPAKQPIKELKKDNKPTAEELLKQKMQQELKKAKSKSAVTEDKSETRNEKEQAVMKPVKTKRTKATTSKKTKTSGGQKTTAKKTTSKTKSAAKSKTNTTKKADSDTAKSTAKKQTAKPKTSSTSTKTAARKTSVKETANPVQVPNMETVGKRRGWWKRLDEDWKKAFNVVLGNSEILNMPTDEAIIQLLGTSNIDFTQNGNQLSFKLNSLAGLRHLTSLEEVIVSGHALKNIKGTEKLKNIKLLDVSNNQMVSLGGISQLKSLEELICNNNKLRANSFSAINRKLPKLRKLNCSNNNFNENEAKKIAALKIAEVIV